MFCLPECDFGWLQGLLGLVLDYWCWLIPGLIAAWWNWPWHA
jgi:hypothetical protein